MQTLTPSIRHKPAPTVPCYLGSETPCPCCTATQWHVGRQTAECASCGTALLLADGTVRTGRPARLSALHTAWIPFA